MSKARSLVVAAATAGIVAASAPDALAAMTPGLWKIVADLLGTGNPDTQETCITPAMAVKPGATMSGADALPGCKSDYKESGNVITWSVACEGGARGKMSGSGVWTFDTPDHYTGEMKTSVTMAGKAMDHVVKVEGTRVGDCKE